MKTIILDYLQTVYKPQKTFEELILDLLFDLFHCLFYSFSNFCKSSS